MALFALFLGWLGRCLVGWLGLLPDWSGWLVFVAGWAWWMDGLVGLGGWV
jgi:hypothetical protein